MLCGRSTNYSRPEEPRCSPPLAWTRGTRPYVVLRALRTLTYSIRSHLGTLWKICFTHDISSPSRVPGLDRLPRTVSLDRTPSLSHLSPAGSVPTHYLRVLYNSYIHLCRSLFYSRFFPKVLSPARSFRSSPPTKIPSPVRSISIP